MPAEKKEMNPFLRYKVMSLTEIACLKAHNLEGLTNEELRNFNKQVQDNITAIKDRARKRELQISNKGKILGSPELENERATRACLQREIEKEVKRRRNADSFPSHKQIKSQYGESLIQAIQEIAPQSLVEILLRGREIRDQWKKDNVINTGIRENKILKPDATVA